MLLAQLNALSLFNWGRRPIGELSLEKEKFNEINSQFKI